MEEVVQIKCPFCGAVLSVRPQPGMEDKLVTCPVCKQKHTFKEFKRVTVNPSNAASDTQYSDRMGQVNSYSQPDDGNTEIAGMNFILGRLRQHKTGMMYQLKPGRNVIGRKATKSEADIMIETGGSRVMSREHIVIDVRKEPAKGIVHYLSLYKEKVNPTFIGKEPLRFGDSIILNHGDIIRFPDTMLRFEIPDNEETVI